jgi:predicted aldo/keto reductase-like oxidoreductase
MSTEEKKLGFGMLNMPRMNAADDGTLGMDEMKKLVDLFLKKGFTYFDAAYRYYGVQSEKTAYECLVNRLPRDWFTLASRLHYSFFNNTSEMDKVFEAQRKNAGVERFDYYMLHDIDRKSYEKYRNLRCFDWMTAKKKQGQIKYAGFSFTDDADMLDRLLSEHTNVDFVQIRMNDTAKESRDEAMDIFECAAGHDVTVIVTSDDPDVIRFVMGFPEVSRAVAGIGNMRQLKTFTEETD